MKINITILKINSEQDQKSIKSNYFFVDIFHTIMKDKINTDTIVFINVNQISNDTEETLEFIKRYLEEYKKYDIVICTTGAPSKIDYPESEYYLLNDNLCDSGRKPIPIDEELEKQREYWESLGFVNVNNYCLFDYKLPFIYPNEIGNKIIEGFNNKIIEEFGNKIIGGGGENNAK